MASTELQAKRSVLVLGMHRSGTSALARVLNLVGVDLGPDLMGPKAEVNERGFWESKSIVEFHDRLLDALDLTWSDTRPLPDAWWKRADLQPLHDELASILRSRFGDAPWWGVKDPRLCRLLPLWRSVLSELCREPLCLIIVRNPIEVAASLKRRDGLDAAHAHQLWLDHNLEAEEQSRGLARVFVSYADLLRDWRGALERAAEHLRIRWPRDLGRAEGEVREFLSADLRHHVAESPVAGEASDLSPWLVEAWRELEGASREGESSAVLAALDSIRRARRTAELHYGPALVRSHNERRALERANQQLRRELDARKGELRLLRREYEDRSAALGEAKQHARRRDDEVEQAARTIQQLQGETARNREWALGQQSEIERLRGIIELRNARIDELVREVGRRGVDLARVQRELESERRQHEARAQHTERIASRCRDAEGRAQQGEADAREAWRIAAEKEHLVRELGVRRAELDSQLERAALQLAEIEHSKTWRWTRSLRTLWSRGRTLPARRIRQVRAARQRPPEPAAEEEPGSSRERAEPVAGPARSAAETAFVAVPAPRLATLPTFESPLVSIVIPVFDQVQHTIACLRAVAAHTSGAAYEVIVVDDGSTDETRTLADHVDGVRFVRQQENCGFVDSCNLGAAHARGDFLVFLNNDTKVRAGWLDAMLETFRRHVRVGAVGAKLIGSDGALQEAGGIIWSDGSGWNYGRGQDPGLPEFSHVREVDYCSGACLVIPRALFEDIGGFDRRYAPAYYEDVDLCFSVRRRGLRVLYQPRAVVEHAEGATAGRDPERGVKRFQEINRASFVEKWADELRHQPAPGSDVRRARSHVRARVLVVDARTPMLDNDAGSLRMFRMMRLLVDLGCHVTFSPEIPVHGGRYTEQLQDAGIEALHDPLPSTETLARHLEEAGASYDVVILSRFYVARNWTPLVRKHCLEARLAVDTVDLHYVRERREAQIAGRTDREEAIAHIRTEELAALRDADLAIVVSEEERRTLLDEGLDRPIEILPTIHDVEPPGPGFWERQGLIFIGSFQHTPNVDAIEWYAREIEPLLQKMLPGVALTVVGGDVPDRIRAFASPTLQFVGQQRDLRPWFEAARISIAPLRFGAGVKGKINTSQSFGVPVVTTRVGAEGLHANVGEELLVADDAASFAAAAVRLYADSRLWEQLARAGTAAVQRRFSFGVAEGALRRIVGLEDETTRPSAPTDAREARMAREIERYREVENVHDLPAIYHWWSQRFLADKMKACEIEGVDEFFLGPIATACRRSDGARVEVVSLGAGNCDLEVRLARRLRDQGLEGFRIRCVEINPHMIERGVELAAQAGVGEKIQFDRMDLAEWNPEGAVDVCMANHSLHHVDELELLFDRVKAAIDPNGVFLVNDMIGRNGHQRWPEALTVVRELWREIPDRCKYNQLLQRFEADFLDWDCSQEGNEGIRAQDILPLLLERFHFEVFLGFANVIDVFIDRAFGHNFDPELPEDQAFIERVARLDEELIDVGTVKPTHIIAALRSRPVDRTRCFRHWTPEFCVRIP